MEPRGPRRGLKTAKNWFLGAWRVKNREKWVEKAGLDRPPSPEAMVDKQMDVNSRPPSPRGYGGQANGNRVATGGEMGRRIGVVGRGCIPGGIGAEKRAASHERLAYSRSGGEKPVKTGIIRKVPVRSLPIRPDCSRQERGGRKEASAMPEAAWRTWRSLREEFFGSDIRSAG